MGLSLCYLLQGVFLSLFHILPESITATPDMKTRVGARKRERERERDLSLHLSLTSPPPPAGLAECIYIYAQLCCPNVHLG